MLYLRLDLRSASGCYSLKLERGQHVMHQARPQMGEFESMALSASAWRTRARIKCTGGT